VRPSELRGDYDLVAEVLRHPAENLLVLAPPVQLGRVEEVTTSSWARRIVVIPFRSSDGPQAMEIPIAPNSRADTTRPSRSKRLF